MNRPNIVYILADDLGYGDVSCLNPQSKIITPHHDRLAREGMTFTDAHSNSAVCTPTRYGLLTGRYCWRSRLKSGVLYGYSPPLLEENRETVARLLQKQGYATACIGKWHLGLGWQTRDGRTLSDAATETHEAIDFTAPLGAGPHTVGFEYSCIIPASLDMAPYCTIENGRVTETPTGWVDNSERPAMWRGGPIAPGFEHQSCLLELTRYAESYIAHQASRTDGQPFFLYFPMPSPHTPHLPRPPFRGAAQVGAYGDFVVEHDWSVGRILEALDRHGLADNTLVIVTSDNGPHRKGNGFDFEREFGHRSSYIYRGQKSDAWDGGHRVPFFARWPGAVPAASTCDQTICLTDLMATCAEITGVSLPDNAGEDSVSTLPLLQGHTHQPVREATVHHSIDGQFAIRQEKWKLITCRGSGGWSLSENEAPASPPGQLYNLENDPGEQNNLYETEPQIVQRLQQLLERYRETGRSVERTRN